MNWTELVPAMERLAETHLHVLGPKLRGWGIEKDEEGWFFHVYTVNTDIPELPAEWEGVRVKQQVRPEAFLAKKQ